MRLLAVRPLLATAALLVAAACSDSTSPAPPLNEAGLQADLTVAEGTTTTPVIASLGALGVEIDTALAGAGGALGIAELPALMLGDPTIVSRSRQIQSRVVAAGTTAAVIPAEALGKTFVYDTTASRYVASDLLGAPLNGVRFILYAVDPLTEEIVRPLVTTGYADITRTVSGGVATARVQAYAGGETPVKVLDYASSVSGSPVPTALVQGFAKNGTDSLTFRLTTAISLVASTIALDWRSEVPTRAFVTRVTQTLIFSETALRIAVDAILRSGSGNVSMKGTVDSDTGGVLTVKVNGETFAKIAANGELTGEPVITGPTGEPLTPVQEAMLQQIFSWFGQAFEFFNALLAPVGSLIDQVAL